MKEKKWSFKLPFELDDSPCSTSLREPKGCDRDDDELGWLEVEGEGDEVLLVEDEPLASLFLVEGSGFSDEFVLWPSLSVLVSWFPVLDGLALLFLPCLASISINKGIILKKINLPLSKSY